MLKIAFDIGGVLSKFPDQFRPLVRALLNSADLVEVWVLSDMKPHEKAVAFCHDNGFDVWPERVVVADHDTYGEACKAVACEQHGIEVLIDDHMGYVCQDGRPPVRLLVMPDPYRPYYSPDWKTDGSEGDFGRRRATRRGGEPDAG